MRLTGFPWRYAAYFFLAIYLFADLYAFKGPLHQRVRAPATLAGVSGEGGLLVARVYGRGLTLLELNEAMRDHLWRRGEQWATLSAEAQKQTRWLVLENLVNDRIVRAFRVMNGLDRPPAGSVTEDEGRLFKKQFEREADHSSRLTLQHLTEDEFQTEVKAGNEDLAWIQEKIAHRTRNVTEVEAEEWYEENKESMMIPPSYRVAHLFLTRHESKKPDREAEIRQIHRALGSGEGKFEEKVALLSEDERSKRVGGDLGWFTAERMPGEVIAALAKLEPGKMSEPVLSRLGWHLLVLKEKRGARVPAFEEVKTEVLALLQTEIREAAVKSLMAELRLKSVDPTRFLFYYPEVIGQSVPAAMPK